MLGIIIDIGPVVAMVSLGQSATASVQAEISSLGTNVLIIIPEAATVEGVRGGLGSVSTVTVEDTEEIEKKVASVATVMYGTRSVLQVLRDNEAQSDRNATACPRRYTPGNARTCAILVPSRWQSIRT
ncbi:MAG: ABC transporter permease [Nitrospiraceae bacterium]|jgi:putative ABC transport system permease protein|uniref:ABC transporter permease n=1 Tax=Nitrospira cf. moscoviensis SBR1015 TaxID=96242 RepID=UPI000A0C1A4D|nr:ABC transporter permease [Nitrospira cf. moscoviensis SBR1015]MBX9658130.1 ABC transporter permease [Nitrospiraceae bacterium]OQW29976.1 MAG: hypothetical protein A4E20_04505 [Nitrospira sp. SG-bin2]